MNKNTVASAAAVLMILGTLPASAGVIYRWQDVTQNLEAGPFEGYIEFSDAAWRPGAHLSLKGSFDGTPASLRPTQDIERFSWTNPSGLGFGVFHGIGMALAPCSVLDTALQDYCEPEDTFLTSGHTSVRFDFDVTFGTLLVGGLSVDTDQAFVHMESGSGPLWKIAGTASEVGGTCFPLFPTGCSGSTGMWVLEVSTLPTSVPEPSTTGLMLLGLSALLAARVLRRKSVGLVARVGVSAALLISAMPASAGVIYRWQDVTLNPNIGTIAGHIEFSYDYWSNGGGLDDDGSTGGPDTSYDPLLGVESFYWDNPSQAGFRRGLNLSLQSCSDYAYCEHDFNFPPGFKIFADWDGLFLSSSRVEVVFGALLTDGRMSFGNHEMGLSMHAIGPLWTLDGIGTDWDGACRDFRLCSGGTGLWVLDLATLPPVRVPEPSMPALIVFAGLALFVSRKLKRNYCRQRARTRETFSLVGCSRFALANQNGVRRA